MFLCLFQLFLHCGVCLISFWLTNFAPFLSPICKKVWKAIWNNEKCLRWFAVLTVPITLSFPKAIFCCWITSILFSLVYGPASWFLSRDTDHNVSYCPYYIECNNANDIYEESNELGKTGARAQDLTNRHTIF